MKKIFGVQAELNLTADEDIIKGIGKGIGNGSIVLADLFKEVQPLVIQGIKDAIKEKQASTVDVPAKEKK